MKQLLVLLLLFAPCVSATEPIEHELVDLEELIPGLVLDIRYATTDNFTGEKLYPFPAAYLQRDAAEALLAVQQELERHGLGLKVFDGYRPLSVQRRMWDQVQDPKYVSQRGRHTRGTAVDLTLVNAEGEELPMPTRFDVFSRRAGQSSTSNTITSAQRANRILLRRVMMRHGFRPFPYEWWHFDWKDWHKHPVLDISFEQLRRGVKFAYPY